MHVFVNGKDIEIVEQSTAATLVSELGLNPDSIVLEHNLKILPKELWESLKLNTDDKIELISFVGGG